MNHILEIDYKNMHAVVEPFVTIYQLQLSWPNSFVRG
jgi:hypothetical protein